MRWGSPPLARGAPGESAQPVGDVGITPARAGSTAQRTGSASVRRDHPRSRGEHLGNTADATAEKGLPPLARGARLGADTELDLARITPARAGSTAVPRPGISQPTDHPRSRGEHARPRLSATFTTGSPPLARGAPLDRGGPGAVHRITPARAGSTPWRLLAHGRVGITPARAGSTQRSMRRRRWLRDHPRSRGEHVLGAVGYDRGDGSPPLARGARRVVPRNQTELGITPARAGSTWTCARSPPAPGDHPRSRGEHPPACCLNVRNCGSPPLARGAPVVCADGYGSVGITPARAGSTLRHLRGRRGPRDHPRSRGEHRHRCRDARDRRGSPPLARGARTVVSRPRCIWRITPARAGST